MNGYEWTALTLAAFFVGGWLYGRWRLHERATHADGNEP